MVLGSSALLLGVLLIHGVAVGEVQPAASRAAWYLAAADTDTTALGPLPADTLAADTTAADTLFADSLQYPLVRRYLSSLWRTDRREASIFQRTARPFSTRIGNYWRHELARDSTGAYVSRETVGGEDVRNPVRLDPATYRQQRLRNDLLRNWDDLIAERTREQTRRQGRGLGFNIVIPGGRRSAFTTIFGKNEVDLRVNGRADIRAGFDYRKSDQQSIVTGRTAQIDPDFEQALRLGIVGTIGDKLSIDVNYDSKNQFDFQNRLKLHYQGYEDEIIQSIEAGNVFLQTPSQLIRGGQSLFGIKSEFQLGNLYLTTVVSQEEGQANSLNIDGGSETTEFDLKPTEYDDNTHFFLAYYFRNRWNDAHTDNPGIITLAQGFDRITAIEVWKTDVGTQLQENTRQAVAMVDLAEPVDLLTEVKEYTDEQLPSPVLDQYDQAELDNNLRNGEVQPQDFLTLPEQGLVAQQDFETGRFRLLQEGSDYTFDDKLGYLSLRSRLQDNEALAVAFTYVDRTGQIVKVGDLIADAGVSDGTATSDRLVLKLLRPSNLNTSSAAAWYLQMRNIYRLPGGGIDANEFELEVYFAQPGRDQFKYIPEEEFGTQKELLELLGLDQVNENDQPQPDFEFDYLPFITIDPGSGLLIFPYLEPFGDRISEIIGDLGVSEARAEELRNLYVFEQLYAQKKANAQKDTQHDVYLIEGSYRGGVQEFYQLNAFAGLVQGSVRVTSGGTTLNEGTDYIVDYTGATLTITNPAYLTAGRDISISYEQNSFFNLQKKTLLGARATYEPSENVALGATVMRLSQKSPVDKFRIGEEPIANTIWGFDGSINLEPRWLTRTLDALPLISTRAESRIQLKGEFAQLRPGHTETLAFERTQRDLRDQGRNFKSDEQRGISYIDDFEGFENTFSLKQPNGWVLASPPVPVDLNDMPLPGNDNLRARANERASFAWYQINENGLGQLGEIVLGEFANENIIVPVRINQVFPNRDTRGDPNQFLQTLDLYLDPHARGPYNYTTDLKGFLDRPREAWGGMMQRLPEGFNDFSLKNIEFVEFIVRPFAENAANDAGQDARLYVDLGFISEDIIPNQQLNDEDGLGVTEAKINAPEFFSDGTRQRGSTPNNAVDINNDSRLTEDLGLDGLASYDTTRYASATEFRQFRAFLDSLDLTNPDPRYRAEVAKAFDDPSGDDYHYFADDRYFKNPEFFVEGQATIQQRFTRFFAATELNSFEGQNELANNTSIKRGNSRYPDSEDRNLNFNIDTQNSYFQYEVPLSRSALDSLGRPTEVNDFVVGEITDGDGAGTGWYQIRIPVRNATNIFGNIEDFTKIENIRLWTTGHTAPITLRIAEFELVGSQWEKSEQVAQEVSDLPQVAVDDAQLTISSINNEENPNVYRTPTGTIISQTRLATGGTQNAREQAMVLRVEDLAPGNQRAIFKAFQGLDLLRYSNVRMFVHMHGLLADGRDLTELPLDEAREKAQLFIRFGANETNDYYEYVQPLTPSELPTGGAVDTDDLWQTNQEFEGERIDLNSVNIRLAAFNQLKVQRDEDGAPTDEVFWNFDEDGSLRGPNAEEFAPPGTQLGIRGNPSLSKINTVVIGVRNPATLPVDTTTTGPPGLPPSPVRTGSPENTLEDATVWINELRVAGYDESNGWAAVADLNMQLADIGSIKANLRTETDGFGSLSSTLGERSQNNIFNWTIGTELNAHKFIPERYGWTIPLSFQVQSQTSTPRFSPRQGDIRVEEILAQIDDDPGLTAGERSARKDSVVEASQTHSLARSYTMRVSKTGSRSALMKYTIDALSFSYSYSDRDARSPSLQLDESWRWSSTVGYTLSIRRPRTVRPFWFLENLPVLKLLGELRLNYLPQSLRLSGQASRNFSQSRDRPRNTGISDAEPIPDLVEFPFRERHTFKHNRTFSLNYNPFSFLSLGFDTNTDQNFNAIGSDTLYQVVQSSGIQTFDTRREAEAAAAAAGDTLGVRTRADRIEVLPFSNVIGRAFRGDDELRTDGHTQRFNASLRLPLNKVKALDWITLNDISYSANYSWANGAPEAGAGTSNSVSFQTGMTLRIKSLWEKFGFYRRLQDAQERYEQEQEELRREREQERARRRQEEEARRAREAAEAEADEDAAEDAPEEPVAEDPDDPVVADPDVADPDAEAPAADEEAGEDEEARPGINLPLPNPVALLRQLALAVTGISDFNITYSGTRTSNSTNVGDASYLLTPDGVVIRDVETPYGFLSAIQGSGVPLGYRFGFQRRVAPSHRVLSPNLQISDVTRNNDRLSGFSTVNVSKNISVSLNWNVDWSRDEQFTFSPEFREGTTELLGLNPTGTQSGQNRVSTWAFGASFSDLLLSQRRAFNEAANAQGTLVGENQLVLPAVLNTDDLLTNEAVANDFRRSFLFNGGSSRLPFPLPGWKVTYRGIGQLPLLRSLAESASLQHSYGADYSTDFRTNTANAPGDSVQFVVGGQAFQYAASREQTTSLRVNRRLAPLIGLDITWKGRIRTQINWNKTSSYSLSTSNFQVSENNQNELSISTSYQKTGLKLPFLGGKRLNNRVSMSLTVAISRIEDLRYELSGALDDTIADFKDPNKPIPALGTVIEGNVSQLASSRRLTVSPKLGYQFSNRVSADFTLRYERFDSDLSQTPSYVNINGGFNISVSIAN